MLRAWVNGYSLLICATGSWMWISCGAYSLLICATGVQMWISSGASPMNTGPDQSFKLILNLSVQVQRESLWENNWLPALFYLQSWRVLSYAFSRNTISNAYYRFLSLADRRNTTISCRQQRSCRFNLNRYWFLTWYFHHCLSDVCLWLHLNLLQHHFRILTNDFTVGIEVILQWHANCSVLVWWCFSVWTLLLYLCSWH
jgi:hypothetical protein